MKRLTISFILTLVGTVLLCVSFVLAAGTPEAEGITQDTKKITQNAHLDVTEGPEMLDIVTEDDWVSAVATAYCPCEICCGIWGENRLDSIVYTASGAIAEEGVTIAADWSIYPPGTVIQVEGMGEYIVQDRGAAIEGQRIDIYFENHEDALQFGVQEVNIKVIE